MTATSSPANDRVDVLPTGDRVNILLVDDQPKNLLALESILEGLGHNLVKAESGLEALRRLLEEDFAVILMDVRMPDMDGFETAKMIRQRDRSRLTPIIFLTAYERSEVQLFQAYSLGAVDFLAKPLVPEVLRYKVAVFAELFQKTLQVQRQAELLHETERREYERQLAEEKQRWEVERLRAEAAHEKRIAEELAEMDRRKDEFLAMLGHELRNPMAPILNALQLLRLRGPIDDPVREILERQVRHMRRLVDDLLDVARITRGRIQLRRESVELSGIVTRAIESTRPLIDARGHRLLVTLPAEAIWLDADPTRLEQVLANLLHNAAKYTDPGGRIWLSAAAEGAGAEVVVRVRDTGVGISPQMLPRVFDLFTQADPSASRSHGGLGIGLTLARQLAELHGGSVEAYSAGSGQGSEFVVRLPLVCVARPESSKGVLTGPHPSKTQGVPPKEEVVNTVRAVRVLVVDDNRDAAESLALILHMDGHEVHLAYDGPTALQAAQAHRPEVVFLDIGLPGMSGHEVARRLREREETSPRLLAAMTGYGQEQDRLRCQESGFDHHLIKPVEPDAVRELLASSWVVRPESTTGVVE